MRRLLLLLLLLACLPGCGDEKTDPREREGFIDTSDPSKVRDTMTTPGGGGDPTKPPMGGPAPP